MEENVVKSGNTVILTYKIFEENKRSFSKKKLLTELERLFETENINIIPWDKQDPYGHADGMVRFIDDSTILVTQIYNYKEFRSSLRKTKLNIEFLDMSKYSWAYINFLQTWDRIIVPVLAKMKMKLH